MTEAEWLACEEPEPMLEFLRGKASDRKLRLFACACGRRVWHLLRDIPSRAAVECGELYADNRLGRVELLRAGCSLIGGGLSQRFQPAPNAARAAALGDASQAARRACAALDWLVKEGHPVGVRLGKTLRDIIGNPFRPVAVDPAWVTSNVHDLARTIYDERAFDRLPILADALMDAGCDSADVLAHCHSPGPHVRGCWVVDLLLGKE